MTLTRKRQTVWLIILTAATLMPSYSLQGWLAGGHAAAELPNWFWVWETVAWSARALIEAGAILFLFETSPQTQSEERTLLIFKVMLIALITLTLGAVVGAAGLGQSMSEALPRPLYWAWAFAVASYAPLMLASVGAGYRIQPHDTDSSNLVTHGDDTPKAVVSLPKAVSKNRVRMTEPTHSLPQLPETEPLPEPSETPDALPQPKARPSLPQPAETHEAPPKVEATKTTAQDEVSLWERLFIPKNEYATNEARYQAYLEVRPDKNSNEEAAEELGTSKSTLDRLLKWARENRQEAQSIPMNGKGH